MGRTFYTYMTADGPYGHLYVGVTNDSVRRIDEHKHGQMPGYTAEHEIDQLVWFERHADIDQAILREKRIKRWRRDWKFTLVAEHNPQWLDLYGDIVRTLPPAQP